MVSLWPPHKITGLVIAEGIKMPWGQPALLNAQLMAAQMKWCVKSSVLTAQECY